MCLWKRVRTYLFLPFGTTLVRQPHYAGGRCADVDHLQDARSQGCEDDAAVCESDQKESASFVSTRLRPTAFASYSTAQGLVRASTMFQDTNFHKTLNYSSVSVMPLVWHCGHFFFNDGYEKGNGNIGYCICYIVLYITRYRTRWCRCWFYYNTYRSVENFS